MDASRVKELETQLKATQASLMSEGALLQQASLGSGGKGCQARHNTMLPDHSNAAV